MLSTNRAALGEHAGPRSNAGRRHQDKREEQEYCHTRRSLACAGHPSRHQMRPFIPCHYSESDTATMPILQITFPQRAYGSATSAWVWCIRPESWAVHSCLGPWNYFISLLCFLGPTVDLKLVLSWPCPMPILSSSAHTCICTPSS